MSVFGGARVLVKQARLIGQYHEVLGFHQIGDQCCERIIVPKANFLGYNTVVLVHYRHDTQHQQSTQCTACIQVPGTVVEIGIGQQHLGRLDPIFAERPLIGLHQPHLSDGCRRLKSMQFVRTALPTQALHAFDY